MYTYPYITLVSRVEQAKAAHTTAAGGYPTRLYLDRGHYELIKDLAEPFVSLSDVTFLDLRVFLVATDEDHVFVG